ncbi:MAG: Hsp20/alpha crystallin family protein [Firmicutes bacterium]|nr:Hsp20/alpha crystallin family protein [Bacillota bacterium]
MLMPTIFGERLFDNFMDDFGFPSVDRIACSKNTSNLMRTDIRETDEGFELDVELPGYKKDDVKVQLKDGYLTVSAEQKSEKEVKDDEGRYLRRERYSGAMSRSFFVGEDTREEDVKARFEDGILKLAFPKEQPKKVEEPKFIAIEG